MPARHAENFPPSGAKVWIPCPGSIRFRKLLGKTNDSNIHTERGTCAHKVFEYGVSRPVDPEGFLGKKVEGVVVDKDITRAVSAALDIVRPIIVKAKFWAAEQWVDIHVTGEGGTADAWALVQNADGSWTLYVWDYKNGRVAVDAERNYQMMLYALGVLGTLVEFKIGKVVLCIIGPNFTGADSPFSEWITTPKALSDWAEAHVAPAVKAHNDGTAIRIAGDHCMDCDARGHCEVAIQRAAKLAATTFADFIAPKPGKDKPMKKKVADSKAKLMTPKQITGALKSATYFASIISACERAAMLALARDPKSVPGFKLVEARTNRCWKDQESVSKALTKMGIDEADFTRSSLLGLGEVAKLIPIKKREAFFAKHTIKPRGKPALARADDKRQALSHAKIDFADDLEERDD